MIQTYGSLLFPNREKLTYFISKNFYIFPHKCQKIFSKIYLLWNGETFYWWEDVFFPKGKIHFWFHVTLIFRAMGSQSSLVCKSLVPRQVHLLMYANQFRVILAKIFWHMWNLGIFFAFSKFWDQATVSVLLIA